MRGGAGARAGEFGGERGPGREEERQAGGVAQCEQVRSIEGAHRAAQKRV